MNALVPVHSLTAEEVDVMVVVIRRGRHGRNRWTIGAGPDLATARGLEQRGLMSLERWQTGDLWDIAVTTAGARELVRLGEISLADLAVDVDRLHFEALRLARYRDDLAERFGQACADDLDPWVFIPNDPYARVAAAVLAKRGAVERRGPAENEAAWAGPDGLFIRVAQEAAG